MISDLLILFISFLKIGSLSFGGAYSLLPVIENETVVRHGWLTDKEFLNVLSVVEIIPGAISIKFATYTGYKVAGIPGAIAANLGNLFTPVILISVFGYFYQYIDNHPAVKETIGGIKYGILGLILAFVYQYSIKNYTEWINIVFMIGGFLLAAVFRLNPVYIVMILAVLATLISKLRPQ